MEHCPLIGAKRVTAKHSSSSQSGLSFAATAAATAADAAAAAAAAAAATAEFFYWLVRKAGIRTFVDFALFYCSRSVRGSKRDDSY